MDKNKIPIRDISEVRVIQHDAVVSDLSIIVGTAAVVGVVILIMMIIYALTKTSCPYVYSFNGEKFIFEGETFGGAIASNLERDDYMVLNYAVPEDNKYTIRLSNELKEHHFTDLAEIITVDHSGNCRVLPDKNGHFQTITNLVPPEKAVSYNGSDLRDVLESSDNFKYYFNDEEYIDNGIDLSFDVSEASNGAKLVFNARNTLWLDYIFGEFLSKFGGSYDKWIEKQEKLSPEERERNMIEHGFPLFVYGKKNGGWELIEFFYTIGPLASRDFVVPVSPEFFSDGKIEIRLESGFSFWEIDMAGLDTSENEEMAINAYSPVNAVDNSGRDWTSALTSSDGYRMAHRRIGDRADISYLTEPVPEGMTRTVSLHTRGYYKLIRDFTGLPRISELVKFREPGYFSVFSREEYLIALKKEDMIMCLGAAE